MYTTNNSNNGGRPYKKEDASRDKQTIELAEFSVEDFRPEVCMNSIIYLYYFFLKKFRFNFQCTC